MRGLSTGGRLLFFGPRFPGLLFFGPRFSKRGPKRPKASFFKKRGLKMQGAAAFYTQGLSAGVKLRFLVFFPRLIHTASKPTVIINLKHG